jgi:hypothetical protein
VTLLFENRETVRFQVQEMARVEHLRDPEKLQHELDVYNELIPRAGELSATLLLEITDVQRVRAELDRLLGIDGSVFLVLGTGAGARRLRARFDERQLDEHRISAVHYLKVALDQNASARFGDRTVPATISIEHPHYRHAAALPDSLRAALVADLAGDPESLLVPPPGGRVDEHTVRASGRVRVRDAEQPAGRDHVVIEPRDDVPAALDLDPALEAALWAAVREQAHELLRRHGTFCVRCDVGAGLRFHVFAPEP